MSKYIKEIAILGLITLEGIALSHGINGTIFTAIAAIIGGIAGYELKNNIKKQNGKQD